MSDVYQSPPILDAVAVELASFCRKESYAEILFNFIQMRVADLKGVQEKSTIKALRAEGMDRISAMSYHAKIFESYERCKRARLLVTFRLPMSSVKPFTSEFRHSTFPRLRSYRQLLVSVQERFCPVQKPKPKFWVTSLNSDPFFCSLVAPPNTWVPRPESDKVVDCRVLVSPSKLPEIKEFLASNGGELVSSHAIK